MQNEIVLEMVAALTNVATGVATQLTDMPKDTGDTVTTPVVQHLLDNEDNRQGQFDSGQANIQIYVALDGPTLTNENDTKSEFGFGSTPVTCVIAHRGDRTGTQKLKDSGYVARAIVLALKAYFAQRQDARTRNEVVMLRVTGLQYGLIADDKLGAVGAVVFTMESLDKRAQRVS
jgi:hypothetical protein